MSQLTAICLKWALIHGLFCGGFCNLHTRFVLHVLNMLFMFGISLVFFWTLP